ncbi:MAG: hypothetical protein FJX55_06350 [Alphaproteobacteria bacterium]|nr:hypothetical protein [Alphaproteobacteria bacterium]
MKKLLNGLVGAAFALVAVAPASAAVIAPRVSGDSAVVQVQATETKAPAKKKQAAKKAPAKKQTAKKKKAATKTA